MARGFWSVIVASGSLLACAASPGEGAPARDAGAPEASTSATLPACGWTLDDCPAHIDWRFDTLLTAEEVSPDAQFIAIGGQAVGVSTGAMGVKLVVRVHLEAELDRTGDRFRRYLLPKGVHTLIDVVDGVPAPAEPAVVYALACEDAPQTCALFRVSSEEADGAYLEPIADSTFDGEPRALLFDENQRKPCVLASSLYCFDGAWREELTPDASSPALRAVAMGSSTSIAVAARGIYWTRPSVPHGQSPMPWTREDVGANVAWTGGSDLYTGYFLIGERGAFMQNLTGDSALCSHTSNFAATSGSVLVTDQGEVLFGLNEGRCKLQQLDDATIVDSATVYCQASQNLLLMTKHSVSGTRYCARL